MSEPPSVIMAPAGTAKAPLGEPPQCFLDGSLRETRACAQIEQADLHVRLIDTHARCIGRS
jgi:hypothetical protein